MSSNIPSEEDFARAKKFTADENRHLSAVVKSVESRFLSRCPMHRVFLLVQDDVDFRAYVFFKTESDVLTFKADGTTTAIENAFYDELERFGRGKRGEIVVEFEWDSDENVKKKCNGDYLMRLR